MKSDSGSAKRQSKWRLSKTLKRRVDYRPIEDEDLKFIWAAYKKGALATMGEEFADGLMSADEFKTKFTEHVLANYAAAWTIFSDTKRGFMPIGVLFASWSPGPYMIVNGLSWFPWATKRNIIEAIVGFFNGIRKEFQMQFYATPEHKRTYEVCAMHGVVRRVGTSYTVFPGKPAAMFETKAA